MGTQRVLKMLKIMNQTLKIFVLLILEHRLKKEKKPYFIKTA
nr:MAG TPA: hypothetical protein [Caudoviricetes sp.]